ncbi:MAG: hypothetical protein ACRC91_08370 [Aeromonas sp.]
MSCTDITVQIIGDITDINVIVKQAQDSAVAAAKSATDADTSAQAASASALEAKGYADNARLSEQNALSSSTQAAAAASQALASENAASASAVDAQTAAGVADTRKQEAEAAEQSASQSATQTAIDATRAEVAATRAENAPVRLKVSRDDQLLNETASELNFTGAGVIIKQQVGDPSIFEVEVPGQKSVSVADVVGLQAALDAREPALGVPASDYMVLASKKDGTRYWIAQTGTNGGALFAGQVGSVQRPITDVQLGAGLLTTFNGQTCTIQCEISKADLDALSARVTALYAPTEAAWQNAFQAAIAQYAQRLAAVEASAAASVNHIASLQSEADANKQLVQQMNNRIIDKVESRVNAGAKTITLTYKNGSDVIDTDLIDISGMFGSPAPNAVPIWFGFTANKPMTEQAVKTGTTEQESVVVGKDIELKRADSTPAFMYVWIPDSLGAISGFSFNHAFLDVWQAYPVIVDGVSGKAYISDNKTAATDVSFEVQ